MGWAGLSDKYLKYICHETKQVLLDCFEQRRRGKLTQLIRAAPLYSFSSSCNSLTKEPVQVVARCSEIPCGGGLTCPLTRHPRGNASSPHATPPDLFSSTHLQTPVETERIHTMGSAVAYLGSLRIRVNI
jgi:hypothetical protein